METHERLILALDVANKNKALELVRELKSHIGLVKIGLEAFVAHGPKLVEEVTQMGLNVFLDLKVHDIPRTAAAAVREASLLGVRLVTVHALGGSDMIRAACEQATGHTQVIAVTILTSIDENAFAALGLQGDLPSAALRLGELAMSSNAHGLVCSAHELNRLSNLKGTRVVPGIRPTQASKGDQKRVATPKMALEHGATWLVVGRPILEADNPVLAAQKIVKEMESDDHA